MSRLWVSLIGAVAIALAIALPRCFPDPPRDPRPAIVARQAAIDSSTRIYADSMAMLRDSVRGATARADAADREARRGRALAARSTHAADSLRALRLALPDSAPCDTSLTLVIAEADSLRGAVDTLNQALGSSLYATRQSQLAAGAAFSGWIRAEGQLSWERQMYQQQVATAVGAWQKEKSAACPRLLGVVPIPQPSLVEAVVWSGRGFIRGEGIAGAIPFRCII